MDNNDLNNQVIETSELETAVEEIVLTVKEAIDENRANEIDSKWLDKFVRQKNRETKDKNRIVAKKRLMPTYLKLKSDNNWVKAINLSDEVDGFMTTLLKAKPRRTASGVATISVLTKPWPCSGNCIFCPNDIRMPKSYIHNEPACQRAEKCNFDPYLQVISRLKVLLDMGHNIDKIELIVLGGTFTDYTKQYQMFYIKELFRALNDFGENQEQVDEYIKNTKDIPVLNLEKIEPVQEKINAGQLTYNDAWEMVYGDIEKKKATHESCKIEDVIYEQTRNVDAKCKNVGLVLETRPDKTDIETLKFLRQLGATKIQIGIQTLSEDILAKNSRGITIKDLENSMDNLRTMGFKSHVHMMANLPNSTPEIDIESYNKLVVYEYFKPDEIKIYPCVCVKTARLYNEYKNKKWVAYSDEVLRNLVTEMILKTPPYTRISRVIRDISTCDIIAGNKTPNLRQIIDNDYLDKMPDKPKEIRSREIAETDIDISSLHLNVIEYVTNNTTEFFLEWVTENYELAGFLRLSIPNNDNTRKEFLKANGDSSSTKYAMIREVHIYGKVAKIHEKETGVQHAGLGRKLIEKAEKIAKSNGCSKIYVISAVGTRNYYSNLGFCEDGLYQSKTL